MTLALHLVSLLVLAGRIAQLPISHDHFYYQCYSMFKPPTTHRLQVLGANAEVALPTPQYRVTGHIGASYRCALTHASGLFCGAF